MYFDAKKIDDEETSCKGKIKFHEFNQDDDELTGDITCEKQEEFVFAVKKILNKEIAEIMMKCIHTVGKAMRDKDADENKIKRDQLERE